MIKMEHSVEKSAYGDVRGIHVDIIDGTETIPAVRLSSQKTPQWVWEAMAAVEEAKTREEAWAAIVGQKRATWIVPPTSTPDLASWLIALREDAAMKEAARKAATERQIAQALGDPSIGGTPAGVDVVPSSPPGRLLRDAVRVVLSGASADTLEQAHASALDALVGVLADIAPLIDEALADLPLSGTEKQVEWAIRLRREALSIVALDLRRRGADDARTMDGVRAAALKHISHPNLRHGSGEAAYWINGRNRLAWGDLFRAAYSSIAD